MVKNKIILISGSVIYRRIKDKPQWFLVKMGEDTGWEIPKTTARRGESSVRAAIRSMAEQGGMRGKVIEEAGRNSSTATVNGKPLPQRNLYYLMIQKEAGEVLGFPEYDWLEYEKAARRLTLKREKQMLKNARDILKELDKKRKKRLKK